MTAINTKLKGECLRASVINDKKYLVDHYKLKSKDESLPNDKKLDFDIWYNSENNLILKVSYSRMGKWEYKLRNFE